jgi:hypothetical protein
VRQLPLLFQRAGIVDVRARGFFPLETDRQSFYAGMADRCAEVAVKAGVITELEGRAWLDTFHEQERKDHLLASAARSERADATHHEPLQPTDFAGG